MTENNPSGRPAGMDTWIRRRKTYVVDKQMQYTYMAMVVGMVLVMIAGIAVSNIVTIRMWSSMLEMKYGRPPDWKQDLWVFLTIDIAIMALLIIAAVFYSVLHSHRVAGPIYRLKQTLIRMQTGDYNFAVTLRTKDLLKEMAEEANKLLAHLQKKNDEMRKLRTRVEQVARRLKEAGGQADHIAELDDVANQITQLVVVNDPEQLQATPLPGSIPLSAPAQSPPQG